MIWFVSLQKMKIREASKVSPQVRVKNFFCKRSFKIAGGMGGK
jgi:hypothetical protein